MLVYKIEDCQSFLKDGPKYEKTGIPYRRGYLLHGKPGCGKSCFIFALAGKLNLPICLLDLSKGSSGGGGGGKRGGDGDDEGGGAPGMSDSMLLELVNSAPKPSILLIEEVDTLFKKKENEKVENEMEEEEEEEEEEGKENPNEEENDDDDDREGNKDGNEKKDDNGDSDSDGNREISTLKQLQEKHQYKSIEDMLEDNESVQDFNQLFSDLKLSKGKEHLLRIQRKKKLKLLKREKLEKKKVQSNSTYIPDEKEHPTPAETCNVSFGGLLQALDGVTAQEGRLVFFTTNKLDQLSDALIRPGRMVCFCFLFFCLLLLFLNDYTAYNSVGVSFYFHCSLLILSGCQGGVQTGGQRSNRSAV